ncbi:protein kinase [Streptomyces sp. ZYX-F-203]
MSEAERVGTPRQDNSARLLAGRYRLGDVLGRGGMGTVWRADDETLGRTVAVKELRFPSNIDEEEKRRLITRTLREAKAIARIRNTSAVTVYDVVEEDDRPWIVMELVEGRSLADVIREDGVLEPRRAAEVGLAVLDVLRSAHRQGILHRDVKPSNVLIAEDGRVVLTDFGIAQIEGDPSLTSTGMLVGAPSYISPERARGHTPGPAADLWSLGGLLYAAVEGSPPYDKGSAIATLTAVMTEPLEEPRNAGPLAEVVHGLLTKDPAKRLDDAGARELLTAALEAPRPEAAPPASGRGGKKRTATTERPGGEGESGEARPRGAKRSTRRAGTASGPDAAPEKAPAVDSTPAPDEEPPASGAASSTGERAADRAAKSPTAGRGSSWPAMAPPDLPARPAPRASLTDVVPRRTLMVAGAVVVALLLALAAVLAFVWAGDDESRASGSGSTAGSTAPASGVAGSGEEEGSDRTVADRASGESAENAADAGVDTAPGGGSATEARDAVESGESEDAADTDGSEDEEAADVAGTHQGDQGYTIGLPEGWSYQSTGTAGDRFAGPDGQKLLVAWTTTPKSDPVADWQAQERYMRREAYERVHIKKVEYRGWNTADWEFTYVEDGTAHHTVDRGFVVNDGLGYALMYTARSADWSDDTRRETWATLTGTFRPKP